MTAFSCALRSPSTVATRSAAWTTSSISRFGVDAVPYLVRVDGDDVGELLVVDLVPFPGEPCQLLEQEAFGVGDVAVRVDDEPGDPQHQSRVLGAS